MLSLATSARLTTSLFRYRWAFRGHGKHNRLLFLAGQFPSFASSSLSHASTKLGILRLAVLLSARRLTVRASMDETKAEIAAVRLSRPQTSHDPHSRHGTTRPPREHPAGRTIGQPPQTRPRSRPRQDLVPSRKSKGRTREHSATSRSLGGTNLGLLRKHKAAEGPDRDETLTMDTCLSISVARFARDSSLRARPAISGFRDRRPRPPFRSAGLRMRGVSTHARLPLAQGRSPRAPAQPRVARLETVRSPSTSLPRLLTTAPVEQTSILVYLSSRHRAPRQNRPSGLPIRKIRWHGHRRIAPRGRSGGEAGHGTFCPVGKTLLTR